MFQRLLRWRGWVPVVGLTLALSLAVPAQAAGRGGNAGWQVTSILSAWWNQLWPGKTQAATPPDSMTEVDRNSGIDPNGLKSQPTGSSLRIVRPSRPSAAPSR